MQNQTQRYMLIFSLGPVQTFIAQARKTRDLWVGSYLVARLMEQALRSIDDRVRVFPANPKVLKIPDIPNKYIALYDTQAEAHKAVELSIKRVEDYWQSLCTDVWSKILAPYADATTKAIWDRQTKFASLFEIYWVIVPGSKDKDHYATLLEHAEAAFAARKRLRDFQMSDEPGEKSTISGEREVLRTAHEDIRVFWKRAAQSLQSESDLNLDGLERLDAIDIIKRFAMNIGALDYEQPFPSTSSIAVAPYLEQLFHHPLASTVLEEWKQATSGPLLSQPKSVVDNMPFLHALAQDKKKDWLLQRDGDLYFAATFTRERLKKSYPALKEADRDERAKQGREALKRLLLATDELKITRPTPYYAVVQMDGDNLGMLLSNVKTREHHTTISRTLSQFSGSDRNSQGQATAESIVESQYPARLVYAGGDDVLAFAPCARDIQSAEREQQLETVLDLANALQQTYCEKVRAIIPEKDQEKVTASTGIVIAHHHMPLSFVMRTARDAERLAKTRYGKNALVVTVLRNSGEQTSVGCHWRYPEPETDGQPCPDLKLEIDSQPLSVFLRFYHLFKADILSPKCVYNLLEEAPILVKLEQTAQVSEVRRVLSRQSDLDLYAKEHNLAKDEARQKLKAYIQQEACCLIKLALQMDAQQPEGTLLATELHADTARYGLIEVLGWLLVMLFFARKDRE
ncbi:type III-B CRISPR-associated protein Cas10/Cmr2 [Tengunoibacter tsumagoiensis]|uniref:Type III-B CRISPR-associated protein Cas10/Cmr2 n=1 Tax=Tengunoibacter tsumagoiensis TaxID=2014871 RepID=A0A402A9I5_9CHLR|nr:type III-B CRISPR-associated protein Cas10/Cmr2 [Tengunoibacter tsumagoiensis]GCE15844.1 type III-B CRISPR-associated protein Cas10/Cmr2 [Tengunoibacter tsumagoiensis]